MLEAADMTTKPKANKSVFIGILLTSLRPTNIDTNATPKVFECYCRLSMKASSKRMMTPLITAPTAKFWKARRTSTMTASGHVWAAPFWQGAFWLQTGRVLSCVRRVDAAFCARWP